MEEELQKIVIGGFTCLTIIIVGIDKISFGERMAEKLSSYIPFIFKELSKILTNFS